MRQATIMFHDEMAGILTEAENEYVFQYLKEYLNSKNARAISLSFPLQAEPFVDKRLFPFFDGLIPEGWLLHIAEETWKLNQNDRMALLLACCKDCIGAVSVIPKQEEQGDA